MLLTSPSYFAFLALVFFAYWIAARNRSATLILAVFANLFFYAKWDLAYLLVVPLASLCDFVIGSALESARGNKKRRVLVAASITLNVSLIASLRYLHAPENPWGFIFPLGLSFYSFQSMTYTIDIYRRDAKAVRNYLVYLSGSSFFATALAGPIARLPDLCAQFQRGAPKVSADEGGRALFLIGLGLVKKFLIADYLAEHLINRVFDTPRLYSGAENLVAVYGYAMQLYYDFSGYTDIAIASALLIGIRLPKNFNRPYAAENVADFWHRWHITLSNWLRDYIYFSLPGLRSKKKVYTYVNLVITMAIGGAWHGANATFLIWGVLHGVGLATVRAWQRVPKRTLALPRWVSVVLTFHFVAFAWTFFRAPNVATAFDILAQIASLTISLANVSPAFAFVLLIAVFAHFVPKHWYEQCVRGFTLAPAWAQAAALVIVATGIQYVAATGAAPFIYTRF